MISKLKYEYLLLLIALGWALFFSFVLQLQPGFSSNGDDGSYLIAAKELYLDFRINDMRPLVIAAIHGFPFLFGFSESAVIGWGIVINFASWIGVSLLLFRNISSRFDRKQAFWLALVFVFCIGNLAVAFNFLSESVFIFLLVVVLYCVNSYLISGNVKFLSLALSLLLLMVLVRPIAVGLVVVLVLVFYRKFKEILLSRYSFFIGVSLLLLSLQMYSLKRNYGDYTISYIGSVTYYNYLGAKADCLKKNIEFIPGENKRTKHFTTLSRHEMKSIAEQDFTNQLISNTSNLFKAYLFCMYSNSSKGSYIVSSCQNDKQTRYFDAFHFLFKAISKVQNILFTLVGILLSSYTLLKKKHRNQFSVLLSLSILYLFLMSAVSCFQADRFHIVLYPLLLLLLTNYYPKRILHD